MKIRPQNRIWRLLHPRLASLVLIAIVVTAAIGGAEARPFAPSRAVCSAGYVGGIIGGANKCLRAGEFCAPRAEGDYQHYGFTCVNGHLKAGVQPATPASGNVGSTPAAIVGSTIKLAKRTQSTRCTRGVLPDRQCSPGAIYSGLTKAVLCSPTFRTGTIRNVPQSEKHQVEVEYGMAPKSYGRTIEIDHVISLEIGGSNDIANLFPEPGSGPATYHSKDKLENRLHLLVCAGSMTLRAAQVGIARDWETLYRSVFGVTP